MKTYSVLLALATLASAAGCASSTHEASDEAAASDDALTSGWQNVLSLSVAAPGYINTLDAPHMTLRPTRGIYMRMSWPLACNAQITGMSLYGATLQGQRVALPATLVAGPELETTGNVAAYYAINGGGGATVREVGLYGYIGAPCTITFEQSDTLTPGGGGSSSGGGGGGPTISGYNMSGFGQCRALPSGEACPQNADPVTDACLNAGGHTSYCSDCTVMCSVPVK
jgi:hypothetical protein